MQIADCPGRREPGTGEINFANLLRRIHLTNWNGLIEMEHTVSIPGRTGEEVVLDICARLSEVSRLRAHQQGIGGNVAQA